MPSKRKRSLVKAVTWRTVATALGIGTIFATTGDLGLSSVAGGGIAVVNGVGYYLHERLWEKSEWGKD